MTDEPRPDDDAALPVVGDAPVRPVETDQGVAQEPDRRDDRAGREPGDLVLALSPRQIIGGFAVLAGLIVLLRRRGRDRS